MAKGGFPPPRLIPKAARERGKENRITDYLVYWKSYWDDVDDPNDVSHDWRMKNENFYDKVERGDNLWVVVSGGKDNPDEWRLLQRICVHSRDPQQQKSKYGPYHIIGDDHQSELFNLEFQPDFTPTLRKLDFLSGRRIAVRGRQIGQTLQSIRPLSDSDSDLLTEYSRTLKPL